MTVMSMSTQEFSRLQVLLDVQSGRMRIEDAAQLIGVGRRQVFRLLKGIRKEGPVGLISKRRGRPSNHRLPPEYRELAMALVRERYADFGPTLAAEKLTELHGFGISRETLRHWMIEDGLWIDRRRRLPSVHQPRNRRECAAWKRVPGVEVVAICTAHQETAEKAQREYGLRKAYWNHEEMSADPELDIIDIGTRPSFRLPMVLGALRNKKHVYCALPFATDMKNAIAMRDAQKAAGTVGVVDAQFRWNPPALKMKQMIDAGFIGKPLGFNVQLFLPLVEHGGKPYAHSAYSGFTDPYYWLAEKSSGGSGWRNFATHSLLMLTHMLCPVEEATGMLTTGVPEWFLPNGDVLKPETHDLGSATLRLKNGVIGSLQAGWCVPDTDGFRLEVWGDRGRIVLTDPSFANAPVATLFAGDFRNVAYGEERSGQPVEIDKAFWTVPGSATATGAPQPFIAMDWLFADMVKAVREDREGSPSFSEAAEVHKVVEAVEIADRERRWVRMSEM